MGDFDPNIPIYLQIMSGIKQDIVSGILKCGDKLSSVRERAESLAVNPNTVLRAYQELEREGVSETRRGMGSYIVENQSIVEQLRGEMAKATMSRFVEGMHALGFSDEDIVRGIENELQGTH